jgi:hypothetical protein
MYDANLGRFLSPDNYIQDPYNTQSFNRFGYGWNNPLKYADPTGEALLPILIGALVGAYIGGTIANEGELNPFAWKWDGDTWKGIIIGAILGAITGESIYALLTPGAKAFGIFTTKVSVLTPLGTVGLATNEARGLDFSYTNKAGGNLTIEDAIRFPDKKPTVTVDASGGHFITNEDYELMILYMSIDSIASGELTVGELYPNLSSGSEIGYWDSLWDSRNRRLITGDMVQFSVSWDALLFVGGGTSLEFSWLLTGDDASFFPYIGASAQGSISDGVNVSPLNFGFSKAFHSGPVDSVHASSLPGWSFGGSVGGKIIVGGDIGYSYSPDGNYGWHQIDVSIGAGLELSPATAANVQGSVGYNFFQWHTGSGRFYK